VEVSLVAPPNAAVSRASFVPTGVQLISGYAPAVGNHAANSPERELRHVPERQLRHEGT